MKTWDDPIEYFRTLPGGKELLAAGKKAEMLAIFEHELNERVVRGTYEIVGCAKDGRLIYQRVKK